MGQNSDIEALAPTKKTRKRRGTDITGMRSDRLLVLEPTTEKRRGSTLWRCKCDCGNEVLIEAYKIRSHLVSSCGCIRGEKRIKDITGQRFGKLTAIKRTDKKRGTSYCWECRCDCGNTIKTTANALISGNTKSCGCNRAQAMKRTVEKYGDVADHLHLIDGTCLERINMTRTQKNNTSGYTGVQARGDKWIAIITFQKKVHYLGIFSSLSEAVQARKAAEDRFFGPLLSQYHDNQKNNENETS